MQKKSDVILEILQRIIGDYTGSIEVEEILFDLVERYGKAIYEEGLEDGKNNL